MMGCRETAVRTGVGGHTTLQWMDSGIPGLRTGEALPGRWYEETLEPLSSAARVVARFADGAAAAVASTYGRGKTLMLGSYVSAAYVHSPSSETERFFAGLLEWAKVELPLNTSGGYLEARTLEADRDTLLFVFNHDKQAVDASIALRMPAGDYRAADLVENSPVQAVRVGRFLNLKKHLDKSGVWVVRLTRQ